MTKPWLAALAALGIIMISCESNEGLPELIQTDEIYLSPDSEENKINQTLVHIAETYEDLLLDPLITDLLINEFDSLFEVRLTSIVGNSRLKSSSFADLYELQSLESGLKYHLEQYCTAIMNPNYEVANFSLSPIIVPGIQVDYTGEDLEGDVARGWYYDENDDKQYIFLDEKLATTIERPVYIIVNDDDHQAKRTVENLPTTKSTKDIKSGNPIPKLEGMKIEYKYESSGKSDYNIRQLMVFHPGGSMIGNRDLIKRINIDTDYSADQYMLGFRLNGISRGYTITYERDWLKSYKAISWDDGRICGDCCKMGHSHEWYQKSWFDYDVDGVLEDYYGVVTGPQGIYLYAYSKGYAKYGLWAFTK